MNDKRRMTSGMDFIEELWFEADYTQGLFQFWIRVLGWKLKLKGMLKELVGQQYRKVTANNNNNIVTGTL